MKKFFKILIEVTTDILNNIAYFVKDNLMNFVMLLNLTLPYLMYLLGQEVAINRGKIAIGGEVFFPVIIFIVMYYIKSIANKIGKGISVPVPDKRFTQVDDDGEVNIEHKRVQELILYVADLEDWMERKGLL